MGAVNRAHRVRLKSTETETVSIAGNLDEEAGSSESAIAHPVDIAPQAPAAIEAGQGVVDIRKQTSRTCFVDILKFGVFPYIFPFNVPTVMNLALFL